MDEELKKEYLQYLTNREMAITLGGSLKVSPDILKLEKRRVEILERMLEIVNKETGILTSAIWNLPCCFEDFIGSDSAKDIRLGELEYAKLQAEFNLEEYVPDPYTCQECGNEVEICYCNRCLFCTEKTENCECEKDGE